MKIIKMYIGETLQGEGAATDGKDLADAMKVILDATKGMKNVRIEVTDGTAEEITNNIRSRYETTYEVIGKVELAGASAEVKVNVKAVSEEEALEKAKEMGVLNPSIKHWHYCDDDDDCDCDCDCDCSSAVKSVCAR